MSTYRRPLFEPEALARSRARCARRAQALERLLALLAMRTTVEPAVSLERHGAADWRWSARCSARARSAVTLVQPDRLGGRAGSATRSRSSPVLAGAAPGRRGRLVHDMHRGGRGASGADAVRRTGRRRCPRRMRRCRPGVIQCAVHPDRALPSTASTGARAAKAAGGGQPDAAAGHAAGHPWLDHQPRHRPGGDPARLRQLPHHQRTRAQPGGSSHYNRRTR